MSALDIESDKANLATKPVAPASRARLIQQLALTGALCLAAGVGIGVAATRSAGGGPLPSAAAAAAPTGVFGPTNKGPLVPETRGGIRVGNPADTIRANPSAPLNATCTYSDVGGAWSPVCTDAANNEETTPLWEALAIEEYNVETKRMVETNLLQDASGLALLRRFVASRSNASTIGMNATAALRTNPTRPLDGYNPTRHPTRSVDGYNPTRPVDGYNPTRPVDGYNPTRPVDGYNPTRPPAKPVDGYNPTRPLDGYNPTHPIDGYNPTRPLDGYNPTRPLDGYNPTRPLDGSTRPPDTTPTGRGRRLGDDPDRGSTGGTEYLFFGPDNRQRVNCDNSDESPFDYVVRIRIGGGGSCSGTLIGPRHVITAAHCIYMYYDGDGNELPDSQKGYAEGTRVDVSREWGCSTTSDPNQRDGDGIRTTTTISVDHWFSWRGWTRYGDLDYDLAVVRLSADATTNQWVGYRHIPQPVGWMSMGFTQPFKENKEYCTAGFPEDKISSSGQYRLYAQCKGGAVEKAKNRILKTTFDVAQGQSGSALYRARHPSKSGPDHGDHGTMFDNDIAGKIQGVTSAIKGGKFLWWDTYTNVFTRVNSDRFYQICDYITRTTPSGVFNPCHSV